uniref:NADH-ubiquinone oxidoreductase chain 2 n=1 Tax=Opilio parietinus TaxID=121214 RepID=E3UHH9_9ARAC|nr:NADH dehydrogenase subunit 2 [Opilio parietinus]ADI92917.1 NADH dehydrogenase subunit 2 [Opilio parietinus]
MKLKPSSISFILMMMLGSIISLSANSWFPIWLGMEMNIIGFIPLMIDKKNIFSTEAALKYFIIQSISSSLLLLMSIQNNFYMLSSQFINLALITKLGAAPFHFWVPSVAKNLSWLNMGVLLTWQKLAPLVIINMNTTISLDMLLVILLSLMMGSLGGLYQTNMKMMMAFSSISHMGWIMGAMMGGMNLMLLYFLIYSFSLMMTLIMLATFGIYNINKSFLTSKKSKLLIYMNMLNLGGMPPLLGFFPKMFTLMMLIKMNFVLISFTMIISAIINLFFYLKLTYSALNMNHFTKKNSISIKYPPMMTYLVLGGVLTLMMY